MRTQPILIQDTWGDAFCPVDHSKTAIRSTTAAKRLCHFPFCAWIEESKFLTSGYMSQAPDFNCPFNWSFRLSVRWDERGRNEANIGITRMVAVKQIGIEPNVFRSRDLYGGIVLCQRQCSRRILCEECVCGDIMGGNRCQIESRGIRIRAGG